MLRSFDAVGEADEESRADEDFVVGEKCDCQKFVDDNSKIILIIFGVLGIFYHVASMSTDCTFTLALQILSIINFTLILIGTLGVK